MSKLYIVATPIGNLEDITLRALRILKEVDFVLCEDTRVTKKLLEKYEIETPTISYHSFSGKIKTEKILELLEEEKNLALVSDAGTPTISDPGYQLISEIREKLREKIQILAIPGPSALVSALSISGLPADSFVFCGFLPHKKGKQTLLKEILNLQKTSAFYESPHRIMKTLKMLEDLMSEDQKKFRKIVVVKEITKVFEQVILGNIEEVLAYFENNKDKIKGEFVVIL